MMHIAMFDAVNSIEGGYTPYRVRVPAYRIALPVKRLPRRRRTTCWSRCCRPAPPASMPRSATRLATIHPVRAQLGAQVGSEVAKKILEWRANDGWATPQTFTPPALPGVWQPTPPAFAPASFVQAGDAKPFGLPTPYYYLPRRPPALNSQEYADAVNEIKAIGGATSTVRTAEQTLQARLWASVGYKEQLGRHLEPGDALHDAEKQPVADRVRAPVRAGQRQPCRTACRPRRPASSSTSSGARCTPSSARAKT